MVMGMGDLDDCVPARDIACFRSHVKAESDDDPWLAADGGSFYDGLK
jgi:hypothetical protein